MFHPIQKAKKLLILLSGILIGSSIFLMTYAYTIEVNVDNAVQYIKKIIIQNSDGTEGSVLNGDNIKTNSINANLLCNSGATYCIYVSNIGDKSTERYFSGDVTFDNGSIFVENNIYASGDMYGYGNVYISGNIYATGNINTNVICDIDGQNCKNVGDLMTGVSAGGSTTDTNFYTTGFSYDNNNKVLSLYVSGVGIVTGTVDQGVVDTNTNFYTTGLSYDNNDKVLSLYVSGVGIVTGTVDSHDEINLNTGSIPYFDGNNITDSNIVYSGGNIGIGITNPLYDLDILGNVNINGLLFIKKNNIYINDGYSINVLSNYENISCLGSSCSIGITDGDNEGQTLIITVSGTPITLTGTNLHIGNTSTFNEFDSIYLIRDGTSWIEISHSINN